MDQDLQPDLPAAPAVEAEDLATRVPWPAAAGTTIACAPLPALALEEGPPDYTDASVLRAGDSLHAYVTSSHGDPQGGLPASFGASDSFGAGADVGDGGGE